MSADALRKPGTSLTWAQNCISGHFPGLWVPNFQWAAGTPEPKPEFEPGAVWGWEEDRETPFPTAETSETRASTEKL